MKAQKAVGQVSPEEWANISAEKRLALLKDIQNNIEVYLEELVQADCEMRGLALDDKINAHQNSIAMQATVAPIASNVVACIDVYEQLVKGKMPKPLEIKEIGNGRYDVQVFPIQAMDKVMYMDNKAWLRIKGKPIQKNPLEKEGGIIAVLGAGNYSSSFEIIRALFIDNSVVVHKAHQINASSESVWEKILAPLVDCKALSYCDVDDGPALSSDKRLKNIYFTGSTSTAKAIMSTTSTEVMSECGGNNPCIIVPGDRPWTKKEIKHHAVHIATFSKLNGGAICGRAQTLVTCRNWPQRREFIDALETALRDETPGATAYYPGTDEKFAEFCQHYPKAKLIQPEGGAIKNSDCLLIEDVDQESFATSTEAFSQVVDEVALDTVPNAAEFLPKAVEFCNTKLLGTLGSSILIDETSQKKHQHALNQALTDMRYGGIAINTMPPYVWMNPYLTWGGNEEGEELISGHGNFGNLMSFENIEKSIVQTNFVSPGHFLMTNKAVFVKLSEKATRFSIRPTWMGLGAMTMTMLAGKFRSKDF